MRLVWLPTTLRMKGAGNHCERCCASAYGGEVAIIHRMLANEEQRHEITSPSSFSEPMETFSTLACKDSVWKAARQREKMYYWQLIVGQDQIHVHFHHQETFRALCIKRGHLHPVLPGLMVWCTLCKMLSTSTFTECRMHHRYSNRDIPDREVKWGMRVGLSVTPHTQCSCMQKAMLSEWFQSFSV